MKIVIIGGTGLIGSQLSAELSKRGHEVIAASPSSGVNTITGEGLSEIFQGVKVVVDVSNSPSFEPKDVMDFFTTSTKNLIRAEAAAGVSHHLALSVIGTDRENANAYFLAKMAQEKLIAASGMGYTILHAAQFFEFVGGIAASGAQGQEIHVSPALFQPIASREVVATLADLAISPPKNGPLEIAGPERMAMSEIVSTYLQLKNDPRKVIADLHAPYFGAEINDRSLTPGPQPITGHTTYASWIAEPGNLK